MRIIIFATCFYEYTIALANSLSKNNEVCLMLPSNLLTDFHLQKISNNIKVRNFNMPRQRSLGSILMMLDIYKKFKSFRPDIIHLQAHGGLWFFLILPYLMRNIVINTIHDAVPHLGEEKFRYRFY